MPVFADQLSRVIDLPKTPQKIISTVPSQTELLFHFGLDQQVTGITNFCIHPAEKTKNITKIGGTKKLDIDRIKNLKPDLIIANKEENERSQLEELMRFFPVWISDVNDLPGAINMIESIGKMLDCSVRAESMVNEITGKFAAIRNSALHLRVAYLIWRKPYMAAGMHTFINSMLQICGLTNAFDLYRYPVIDAGMLAKANPDAVFLSSEPYPFRDKYIHELEGILPNARIILVDGEMFSWYGSRLLYSPAYFSGLISSLNTSVQNN